MTSAVLLAAGSGTRLRPYTHDRPKCMVKLAGRSLISTLVGVIRDCDICEITVVGGYRHDAIDAVGIVLLRNEDYESTNMVDSLMCSKDRWTERTIVSYADILYEKAVLRAALAYTGDIGVIVDMDWDRLFRHRFGRDYLNEAEDLLVDDEGRITRLGLPRPAPRDVHGQFIGLLSFSHRGLMKLAEVYEQALKAHGDEPWMRGRPVRQAYMTDMLQKLIDLGEPVQGIPIRGGWLEVDYVSDLELYDRELAASSKLPYYDPNG